MQIFISSHFLESEFSSDHSQKKKKSSWFKSQQNVIFLHVCLFHFPVGNSSPLSEVSWKKLITSSHDILLASSSFTEQKCHKLSLTFFTKRRLRNFAGHFKGQSLNKTTRSSTISINNFYAQWIIQSP